MRNRVTLHGTDPVKGKCICVTGHTWNWSSKREMHTCDRVHMCDRAHMELIQQSRRFSSRFERKRPVDGFPTHSWGAPQKRISTSTDILGHTSENSTDSLTLEINTKWESAQALYKRINSLIRPRDLFRIQPTPFSPNRSTNLDHNSLSHFLAKQLCSQKPSQS